jgi:protein phosphatase
VTREIVLPRVSLVLLVGASGSGKTTFAQRHFKPTEVLSSDRFRQMIGDDANDQRVSREAFEVLRFVAELRLSRWRLTVVDATNVRGERRRPFLDLARRRGIPAVAIVLDLPAEVSVERNRGRPEREVPEEVVREQQRRLARSLPGMADEGFAAVLVLRAPEEVDAVRIVRAAGRGSGSAVGGAVVPAGDAAAVARGQEAATGEAAEGSALEATPRADRVDRHAGPAADGYDIIGDVHGCADELEQLLERLGYEVIDRRPGRALDAGPLYRPPDGRIAVFLGDLVDRGPRILDTLRIVARMRVAGWAVSVMGNHEQKLLRKLQGRDVVGKSGLETTLAEIEALPARTRERFAADLRAWLESLPLYLTLDDDRVVVAHGGLREDLQGRDGGAVRSFALYGDPTGELDAYGLPIRRDWAAEYRGARFVAYGHTPVAEPKWAENAVDIDTGCAFGGSLTCLRWPERETVSVRAARVYRHPGRPFLPEHGQDAG